MTFQQKIAIKSPRLRQSLSALAALSCLTTPMAGVHAQDAAPLAETSKQRDDRMHWWREARFGMFIHWGLYAVPAGAWDGKQIGGLGEWIMNDAEIPVAPYAAQATQFDPEKFDAAAWVKIAKAAGMKYIVITAKHHEGFAMFHTKVDSFDLWDASTFKRDPIRELDEACKKAGIKFGVYYSQAQDWHHPGGGAFKKHWDPAAQDGSYDDYLKNVAVPQVKELITEYHPAVLWFDTPVNMTKERVDLFRPVLALDSKLIVNNRLGEGFKGDTETPEQHIPATGYPGRDWETCMTINDTWGYKSFDTNFKSTETLLRNLIDIASKGGNYLLNVGPTSEGLIPQPEIDRIQQVGDWLKDNGEAIYATSVSPFKRLSFDGRATVKGQALYLHVFHWQGDTLTLTGLTTGVKKVKALVSGESLKFSVAADGVITIAKPSKTDPLATVIKMELKDAPSVSQVALKITAGSDKSFRLAAPDATIKGETAQLQGDNIGYWTEPKDTVNWDLNVAATQAGAYKVELEYSCEAGSEGSTFAVKVDGSADPGVNGTIASTGSWNTFKTVTLDGTLNLPAGPATVRVVPITKPGLAVMNIRRIRLIPVAN